MAQPLNMTSTDPGSIWTIPSELPELPPLPGGGPSIPPEFQPDAPQPGDPDYIPPQGDVTPHPWPTVPAPKLYTDADIERARREGAREEATKALKQTVMAAVVTGVVSYGLARVLP